MIRRFRDAVFQGSCSFCPSPGPWRRIRRYLLLDEITANLDSGTEEAVTAALDRASENRTVLAISTA